MITDFLILVSTSVLSAISLFLPTGGLPTVITSSLQQAASYLYVFDPLIDISTLVSAIGLLIAFEITLASINLFRYVFGFIPFIGKSV
jgi:hypothetical protein